MNARRARASMTTNDQTPETPESRNLNTNLYTYPSNSNSTDHANTVNNSTIARTANYMLRRASGRFSPEMRTEITTSGDPNVGYTQVIRIDPSCVHVFRTNRRRLLLPSANPVTSEIESPPEDLEPAKGAFSIEQSDSSKNSFFAINLKRKFVNAYKDSGLLGVIFATVVVPILHVILNLIWSTTQLFRAYMPTNIRIFPKSTSLITPIDATPTTVLQKQIASIRNLDEGDADPSFDNDFKPSSTESEITTPWYTPITYSTHASIVLPFVPVQRSYNFLSYMPNNVCFRKQLISNKLHPQSPVPSGLGAVFVSTQHVTYSPNHKTTTFCVVTACDEEKKTWTTCSNSALHDVSYSYQVAECDEGCSSLIKFTCSVKFIPAVCCVTRLCFGQEYGQNILTRLVDDYLFSVYHFFLKDGDLNFNTSDDVM